MKRLLAALACACLSCTEATGAGLDPPAEPVPEAVKSITAREIGGHLRFLASDLMKGRFLSRGTQGVAGADDRGSARAAF